MADAFGNGILRAKLLINFLELLDVVLLSWNNLCPWNAHTCGWNLRFIEYSLVWPTLLYRCGFSM
jgi:hypothetical protein